MTVDAQAASGLPHEPDYIERTIATVRIHRDADNCWPQWANIFADQIEALMAERERCSACNGVGVQAGAHTETVIDCHKCSGTGRKKVGAR